MSEESRPQRARQQNDGVRKLCGCARRKWPKCEHPWHFNYKHAGDHFRLSLERRIGRLVRVEKKVRGRDLTKSQWVRDRATLGDPIATKTDAEHEADRLRTGIRDRSLLAGATDQLLRETLTLEQLMTVYWRRHIEPHRPRSLYRLKFQIAKLLGTDLERPDGTHRAIGQWLVEELTADAIDQFQQVRLRRGVFAANRDLQLLRALFGWAVRKDHVARTPFKKHGQTTIKFSHEAKRSRRLQPGEAARILAACGPHLRALVEAALETGCRRGELLSLQWWQVRLAPKAELFLPGEKTKTKGDRTVPISTRLRAVLEMRRTGPDGAEHPADAYVFGNEAGQPVKNVKRAWQRAVLKAHGYTPADVVLEIPRPDGTVRRHRTGRLTPACQAQFQAIGLHFHDLRREAGSRWLDAGVPLHRIRKWLGHANISQTSTYLAADSVDDGVAMAQYEERLQRIATPAATGAVCSLPAPAVDSADLRKTTETHH